MWSPTRGNMGSRCDCSGPRDRTVTEPVRAARRAASALPQRERGGRGHPGAGSGRTRIWGRGLRRPGPSILQVMDVCRGISCASFWDALVVKGILEEHGVQVGRPDEAVPLTLVASGSSEEIEAAVAQFSREFPGADPVVIE